MPPKKKPLRQFARRWWKPRNPHIFFFCIIIFRPLEHCGLWNNEKKVSLFRRVPSSTMSSGNLARTPASGLLKSCGHSELLLGECRWVQRKKSRFSPIEYRYVRKNFTFLQRLLLYPYTQNNFWVKLTDIIV